MRIKATVEVTRLIPNYGFKGVEKRKDKNGEERNTWVTVWTKEAVREGETLDVSGDLTVKIESFTGRDNVPKQVAAININNPTITRAEMPF
jgi:isopentenyl phosphate kinase